MFQWQENVSWFYHFCCCKYPALKKSSCNDEITIARERGETKACPPDVPALNGAVLVILELTHSGGTLITGGETSRKHSDFYEYFNRTCHNPMDHRWESKFRSYLFIRPIIPNFWLFSRLVVKWGLFGFFIYGSISSYKPYDAIPYKHFF